ncbi:hypothetical protein PMF13cell1_02760 [Blautia producta]|uniref:EF2563 family selenium-dependent molybdenum hydroxylase system protein n=1 Tax=Blautia producta TaxID=33035 RepID=A0A4P6LYH7_9FIRM|nr:selenium-dependent molybdenum cofactor biosynthesis protein YqeB [Blautia producta]QBE97206.1 hypothetical protein PMF13cell1_02760 [Blautia producta]
MRPIVVRGGGDLATGTIHRLGRSGYPVIILETDRPSAIRRLVAFSQAVYDGETEVEGMVCKRVESAEEALAAAAPMSPVLLVDPACISLDILQPEILIDGILAKRNLGTRRDMAELTIALGPGFEAGRDVDYVVETKRGHYLGRILKTGCAIANTGVPGMIGGYGKERVIHSDRAGIFRVNASIGDWVEAGTPVGYVETPDGQRYPQKTVISGVLRGILPDGYRVTAHFKSADVDPREESRAHCTLISDKARCIAGSVLELVSAFEKGVLR